MNGLSDNLRGALLMMLAMAAFTLNDACMKSVTAELPLFQTIFLRGGLTLAFLLAIAGRLGGMRWRVSRPDRKFLALRTLGEVGGTITFLTALMHMPFASLSAILQVLPLAVTLAAALFLRERVGWRRMLAIAVGFSGVMLIVRPGTASFDGWSLIGLASVAFVVIRDLATRQISRDVTSVTVAALAAASVTAMAALALPFSGWEPLDTSATLRIAGASAFLIVGYLAIVMAMRVGDVSVVAPLRYTALVFAIALGWGVFGEFPDALTLAGALIVIATGIYTFYRERQAGRKLAAPHPATLRIR